MPARIDLTGQRFGKTGWAGSGRMPTDRVKSSIAANHGWRTQLAWRLTH